LRMRHQFFRRVGPVRKSRMQMEIGKHGLMHCACSARQGEAYKGNVRE
jgi:hypothetical protein